MTWSFHFSQDQGEIRDDSISPELKQTSKKIVKNEKNDLLCSYVVPTPPDLSASSFSPLPSSFPPLSSQCQCPRPSLQKGPIPPHSPNKQTKQQRITNYSLQHIDKPNTPIDSEQSVSDKDKHKNKTNLNQTILKSLIVPHSQPKCQQHNHHSTRRHYNALEPLLQRLPKLKSNPSPSSSSSLSLSNRTNNSKVDCVKNIPL